MNGYNGIFPADVHCRNDGVLPGEVDNVTFAHYRGYFYR